MKIIEFQGPALTALLDALRVPAGDDRPYILRVMDQGGLKFKVNEGVWSPPLTGPYAGPRS